MSEVIVELKNITKRFGSFLANDNLSLSIKKGEIHALLGENGAGKSTLMNILYGLVSPTSGEIFLHGKKVEIKNSLQAISLGIGMVHQHFMLIETFTVTESIVLGRETSRYGLLLDLPQAEHAIQKISAEFGPAVNPRAKISEISVGMQQRVEIIKALYHQAEILILDEPTAVLTPLEIEEFGKIIKRLSSLGKTIIIITHKLKEIKALADRCTIICKGKLVDTVEVAQTSEQELAYKMVGRKVEFKFNKTPPSSQKKILSLQNIVALNKRGLPALQNLSIELYTGEILGIAGIDGNGQSELAEILTGLRAIESGKIEKNGEDITNKSPANLFLKKISSIPEDRQKRGLVLDFSVAENMILQTHHLPPFSRLGFLQKDQIEKHALQLIERFDVRPPQADGLTSALSGGNQQKVIIARELSHDPDILIAVQPTRGLDVGAIEYVHRALIALRSQGKAILLISLELDEIINLSDKIAVIFDGKIVANMDALDAD